MFAKLNVNKPQYRWRDHMHLAFDYPSSKVWQTMVAVSLSVSLMWLTFWGSTMQ